MDDQPFENVISKKLQKKKTRQTQKSNIKSSKINMLKDIMVQTQPDHRREFCKIILECLHNLKKTNVWNPSDLFIFFDTIMGSFQKFVPDINHLNVLIYLLSYPKKLFSNQSDSQSDDEQPDEFPYIVKHTVDPDYYRQISRSIDDLMGYLFPIQFERFSFILFLYVFDSEIINLKYNNQIKKQ